MTVTTTLADVQSHLRTLTTPSTVTILLCMRTATLAPTLHQHGLDLPSPPRATFKARPTWFARRCFSRTIQDHGHELPADMIPKRSRGSGGRGSGDGRGGGSGRGRGGGIPGPSWSLAYSDLVLLSFSSNNIEGVRIRGNLWDGKGSK